MKQLSIGLFLVVSLSLLAGCCTSDLCGTATYVNNNSCATPAKRCNPCNTCNSCNTCVTASYAYGGWY